MGFASYKYTFRLNASHTNVGKNSFVHSHTFEIALYMKPDTESFVAYDVTEKAVNNYLTGFSGKVINSIPPFDEISPTVENIGEIFYVFIADILAKAGYQLIKLEISESPQRIFSISESEIGQEKLARLISIMESARPTGGTPSKIDSGEKVDIIGATVTSPTADASADSKSDRELVFDSGKKLAPVANWKFALCVIMMFIAGAAVMIVVKLSGIYPLGLDIHGHLFKSDLMYHEIGTGNWFPLYTRYWYNGVQPFRYWAPLPYYCMALLQFIGGGSVMSAYLAFIWLSFTVGGIGWLLFARKLGRPWLGFFFALLWFLLPENLRVFFGEGNLPRMFIAMFIPYILYCLWQFVCYKRKWMIVPLILLMPFAILGHLMIAAMIGVASAIFLVIYSFANKRYIESITALFAMLLTFAMMGIWLYPALVGGLTSMGSEATATVMASTSQGLLTSLNPFLRLDGSVTTLYFGLSIVIISFIGLFLSNRKSMPGFSTFLIIVAGTSTALTPLILLLPLSQYFWVSRFTPIVYAMFIIAFLEWRSLKKAVLIVLCASVFLDIIPSLSLSAFDKRMNIPATHEVITGTMDEFLYTDAKTATNQRVSMMDLSYQGPLASYAFGTLDPKTQYVFGWAWQGASTAMNIAYLNESLEKGNYLYMFDRNLELGADTVLIDKQNIHGDTELNALLDAAERVGYKLIKESQRDLLFEYPVNSTFGVITEYSCLAIGTTAALVPGILPDYHPGDKLVIDEYSVEELIHYDKIFLSGFFYNDRKVAEKLVREIAEGGVEVFIDMSRIPADPLTNRMTFLDVDAQPITFSNSFPTLITEESVVYPKLFADDYEIWNTVYLNGLENVTAYAWFENSPRLDFIGTGEPDNITFIGFNLLFHAYMAEDNDVKEILNSVMDLEENSLPERTVVPLEVEYGVNRIVIRSEYDNVNTTIAYQDIFESNQKIRSMNNLLIVNKGTTVITMKYPHLGAGLFVSIFGVLAEVAVVYLVFRKSKKRERKPVKKVI